MEIGRGFQHAHNSVKMCAVTHEHSPGGGGESADMLSWRKARLCTLHTIVVYVREDNNGVFFYV